MIQLEGISKSYGSLRVLRDVNLSIGTREILAVVGPSGAGKTTMLQILGTIDRADSGRVIYDGTDVGSMKDRLLSRFRNEHIGFIFQTHCLLPEFTARENVALPAMIAGVSKSEALRRADELLERLGLGPRATHRPSAMSGGERQRTAVGRALINNPRVILADEPTGSLDSSNRDEIERLFVQLRDEMGHTLVIVTHDPHLAAIADRTVAMEDGRVAEG